MESIHVLGGICASCAHARGCTYNGTAPRFAVQCAEFSPCTPVEVNGDGAKPARADGDEVAVASADRALLGLCRSCEGREICTYARAEGGVWRCEEYR